MKIKISAVGALTWGLPGGKDILEADELTVQEALEALAAKGGEALEKELFEGGKLRAGLALLLNGRNVLSLPDGFQTRLKDKDELIIAVIVAGG